jgi:hypothetical protein
MKRLRLAIFACVVCLCSARSGLAQDVYGNTTIDIDPDTGTRMLVSPSVSSYTGVQIQELVIAGANSCPTGIATYTNFPNLVSTFTVGATASWEGVPFSGVLNSFYDQHAFYFNFDVLGLTSTSSCTATATQTYSCNGHTIGTFNLTNTYNHGSLSGVPVTNITTTKQ